MLALEIKNLQKVYRKGVHALKGIDLEVKKGDFFALLGPNGAGKSTTIGIICSLVNKTEGTVKVLNHDIETEEFEAKSALGIVPQEFNFNQFEKVIDIILNQAGLYGIPSSVANQNAEKYLKKLNLWHKRNSTAKELSGGMKRRLMIARALVHDPRILILDEPTAGVDIEIRRSTWEFLKELNANGVTIILTTHYLEEAEQLCKNVAIIDKGKIIESTTIKKLIAQLQFESIVLDLAENLDTLPVLEGFEFSFGEDNQSLEVTYNKTKCINDLFKLLCELNIKVTSLRNKNNRLEELFIRLCQPS